MTSHRIPRDTHQKRLHQRLLVAWLRATLLSIRLVDSHHPSPFHPLLSAIFSCSTPRNFQASTIWPKRPRGPSNKAIDRTLSFSFSSFFFFYFFLFSSFFSSNVREHSTSRLSLDLVDSQFTSIFSVETIWHTNIFFNLLLVKLMLNGKSIFFPFSWMIINICFEILRSCCYLLFLKRKDTNSTIRVSFHANFLRVKDISSSKNLKVFLSIVFSLYNLSSWLSLYHRNFYQRTFYSFYYYYYYYYKNCYIENYDINRSKDISRQRSRQVNSLL